MSDPTKVICPNCVHEFQAIPESVQRRIAALEAQLADHEASFNLRWNADQRAIKLWQAAHPDKPLMWPDHADLCVCG